MASMDRKLLSRQDHEVAYVRKLARQFLKYCREERLKSDDLLNMKAGELKRLCAAVVKFARKKQ
jgi:hypothetical protein